MKIIYLLSKTKIFILQPQKNQIQNPVKEISFNRENHISQPSDEIAENTKQRGKKTIHTQQNYRFKTVEKSKPFQLLHTYMQRRKHSYC